MVGANPHPPPKTPNKLTLPQWLLKALGPTSVAARNAAVVPWWAEALQEGCARDQPFFAGAWYAHKTLEWVVRCPVRCQIRRHGEKKGHLAAGPSPQRASQPSAGGH